MNDNKWKINLSMAGDSYPVWIKREDEEIVRKAAAVVDERIRQYRVEWPDASNEKINVVVAYLFALDYLQEKERHDIQPYKDKIKDLTEELEEYFRKNK